MQASVVQGRMNNPVMVVPGALQPLLELAKSAREVGLSPRTALRSRSETSIVSASIGHVTITSAADSSPEAPLARATDCGSRVSSP